MENKDTNTDYYKFILVNQVSRFINNFIIETDSMAQLSYWAWRFAIDKWNHNNIVMTLTIM